MLRFTFTSLCCSLLLTTTIAGTAAAADKEKQSADEKKFAQLTETLSGSKLVGRFTVLGKEDGKLPKEEYTIVSAKKLPKGDLWLLTARIKYGKRDVTLPIPLEIKWAGDTPIITLTNLSIPGLGTFSSRVVIYNNKYAGTWTHGKVGGHLFGTVEKMKKEETGEAKP